MRGRTVLAVDVCRAPSDDAYFNPFVDERARGDAEAWLRGASLDLQRRWMFGEPEGWTYLAQARTRVQDEAEGTDEDAWKRLRSAFVPVVMAAGGRVDVEPVRLHPEVGCRFGRALKVQALPTPTVRMRASWEVPKCGVLVQLQYTLPIQKEWMHAPGKLELRLADARRKWLKIASSGIEVDAKTWRIADAAALRVQARADVARELPRKQDEPLMHVEIERLGVQAVL